MKRKPSIPALFAWAFLVLGIALRLWYYLDARSLFIDEANLALNISELSYSSFFQPLLHDQYAPPLFMVLSRGAVQLLGNHEWALRLWPLAGSVALLFTFYYLNKKLQLAPAVRWFPIALLALSPFLVRYGTELKQYSTDSALALGAVMLALQLPPEKMKGRHHLIWGLAGGIGLWLSMPAVFLLCGVGAYYLYGFTRQKDGKALSALAAVGAFWIFSFTTLYRLVLQDGVEKVALQNYHADFFFPLQLWAPGAWAQMGSILYGLLSPALGFTIVGLAVGASLLIWGGYCLYRQHTGLFLLIAVAVLACFAASALHRFSLIPRVALFLMPLLLLPAAYGASETWKSARPYFRVALLALLILEAAPFANSLGKLGKPTEIENLKGLLTAVREKSQGEPAFIELEAVPAYSYYSRWHIEKEQYRLPDAIELSWDSNLESLLRQQQQKSTGFWLIFSHLVSEQPRNEMNLMRKAAKAVAEERESIEKTGAAGYRYEY